MKNHVVVYSTLAMRIILLVVSTSLLLGCSPRRIGFNKTDAEWLDGRFFTIRLGLEAYKHHVGSYPIVLDDLLTAERLQIALVGKWKGPYIGADVFRDRGVVDDGMGRALVYESSEGGDVFVLKSLGIDGVPSDDDRGIVVMDGRIVLSTLAARTRGD